MGYAVHKFESDRQYAGAQLDEEDMLTWEHFEVFAIPARAGAPP